MKFAAGFGILVVLVHLFAGERGLPALLQSKRDAARLAVEIAALRASNAALAREAAALRDDPRAIESVARERLGFARADELVVAVRP